MMSAVVSIDKFIEDKGLREKYINKLEVLDKVKKIITLPNTELMTTKMVAEWYEVEFKTIQKLIERNLDELTENGMVFKKYGEIKAEVKTDTLSVLESIPRRGTYIFSKRALLNVGMLLRDSIIARRVRTALLDQQEELTDEQKVKGINEEERLLLNIIRAKDDLEKALAIKEYNEYKNRHIRQLEEELAKQKPKARIADQIADGKNLLSVRKVAKNIGIGEKKFFEFLRTVGVFYKEGETNLPKQQYQNKGYFDVKIKPIETQDGIINTYVTKITGKGEIYLLNLVNRYGGAEKINKLKLDDIKGYVESVKKNMKNL
jgi:phage antirepressor YoqD-like protein